MTDNKVIEFNSITDRELAPSVTEPQKNIKPLPKGTAVDGNRAVITEKRVALDMFDSGFPVFVIGEDGAAHILESREDVENHSGMYTVPADDMYLFLERDVQKERTQSEAEKANEQQERALTEISAFTGVSVMRLYSLPPDVKHDVIAFYMTNVNVIGSGELKTRIQNVLDGKPTTEQINPLAKVEELIEGNYNNIDGVINNLPPAASVASEETERPSVLKAIRELRGERSQESELGMPFPLENERQR